MLYTITISFTNSPLRFSLAYGFLSCISSCPFVPLISSFVLTTTLTASSKILMPCSISSSLMINGGTNLNVFVPHVMTNNPRSLAAVTTGAGSMCICNPRMSPRPRTSPTASGNVSCRRAKCDRNTVSQRRTCSCKLGSARRPTMLCASRQASGFPPNVVPWSPVTILLDTASLTMVAPMGKPLPRAFAVVMTSGWDEAGREA